MNLNNMEIVKSQRGNFGVKVPLIGKDEEKELKGRIGKKQKLNGALKAGKGRTRRSNPIIPGMADYSNWVLYDRNVFAAGSNVPTNFKFFTQPIGQNNKTKVDTNLELVSQLPQPYWMNVTGIGFWFNTNVLPIDLNAFLAQSYMEFWVQNKVYAEGPFHAFPSGMGVSGFTTETAQSTNVNGLPQLSNMFDTRLPAGLNLGVDQNGNPVNTDGLTGITILQGQTFKIEVNLPGGVLALTAANATPNIGTGLTVQAYLYGILSRSAQ